MACEAKALKAKPHHLSYPPCIVFILEGDHKVVRKADQLGLATQSGNDITFKPTVEQESRPGELPPQPLAERCVSFSAHTAPIRQTHPSFQSTSDRKGQALVWRDAQESDLHPFFAAEEA